MRVKATSICIQAKTVGKVIAEGAVLTLSQHWIRMRERDGGEKDAKE